MSFELLSDLANEAAGRFPELGLSPQFQFLGNYGGFSSAALWRIRTGPSLFCLRCWPSHVNVDRVNAIHRLMIWAREKSGLSFIPRVLKDSQNRSAIERGGRVWEVTQWMPGKSSYHDDPSPVKLRQAMHALARLHESWRSLEATDGACRAVERRLRLRQTWLDRLHKRQAIQPHNSLTQFLLHDANKAVEILSAWDSRLVSSLTPWLTRTVHLQPCLCDIWHDHLLYEGTELVGLIDFGSVKIDNIALDLARLLGSLAEDDREMRQMAMAYYEEIRLLAPEEINLVDVLDQSGTLLALVNWLIWLYMDRREFDDGAAVKRRLQGLLKRIEKWPN